MADVYILIFLKFLLSSYLEIISDNILTLKLDQNLGGRSMWITFFPVASNTRLNYPRGMIQASYAPSSLEAQTGKHSTFYDIEVYELICEFIVNSRNAANTSLALK